MASIGNFVWNDLNLNGQQDGGELGIAGVTVRLLDTSLNELATTTTDSNGQYQFEGLGAGDYKIQFLTPEGYAATGLDSLTATDINDSDANAFTGITATYTLGEDTDDTSVDAGFYSVNNAPVTQSTSVSATENTTYVFQLADFPFDDSADAPNPDSLANVLIRSLPSSGALMFDADGTGGNDPVAVSVGQVISASDIADGRLTFVPDPGENGDGYASFGFQVQDDGPGPALYQTGPNPSNVNAVDVNDDGELDLVYISEFSGSGQLGIRLGNGDGTFGAESRIALGDSPSEVMAVDLNGDDNPDLVVTNHALSTVRVLMGNGDGTFDSPVTIDDGVKSVATVAGYFNNDLFIDLAVADRENSQVRIMLGDGTGTGFTTTTYDTGSAGSVVTSVAIGDFNEDSNIDLVFVGECDQFGNFNTGNVTMVLGNGDGTFQAAQDVATGLQFPFAVKTADFNDDGFDDLVYNLIKADEAAIVVQLGNGNGTFGAADTIAMPAPPIDLAVADIDGDGELDLIATDYQPEVGAALVFRGNGDGTFQAPIRIPTAAYAFSVATGYFNGDDSLDIVTTHVDNNLSVLLNGTLLLADNRNISATATITINVGESDAHNDFNGDGRSDLLWQHTSGTFSEWQSSGDDFTPNVFVGGVGTDWHSEGSFDFSGDGQADLLWRNDTTGQFTIWNSTGDGFAPNSFVGGGVSNDWTIAALADFNGDGYDDMIFRNTTTGTISEWQSTGTGFTPNVFVAGVDNSWHLTAAADFNGDGKSDLLWRNDNGTFTQWQSNGDGFDVNAYVDSSVDTTWHVLATGDFNGDGRDDLLFRHDDGTITEWQSTESGGFTPNVFVIGGVSNDWQLAQTGDFNGDGKDDLIFRNDSGVFTEWQSTGDSFTPNVVVGSVDSDWNIITHQYDVV